MNSWNAPLFRPKVVVGGSSSSSRLATGTIINRNVGPSSSNNSLHEISPTVGSVAKQNPPQRSSNPPLQSLTWLNRHTINNHDGISANEKVASDADLRKQCKKDLEESLDIVGEIAKEESKFCSIQDRVMKDEGYLYTVLFNSEDALDTLETKLKQRLPYSVKPKIDYPKDRPIINGPYSLSATLELTQSPDSASEHLDSRRSLAFWIVLWVFVSFFVVVMFINFFGGVSTTFATD